MLNNIMAYLYNYSKYRLKGDNMGIITTKTYCKQCKTETAHAIRESEGGSELDTSICLTCGKKLALEAELSK